jgi:hypothetical protein
LAEKQSVTLVLMPSAEQALGGAQPVEGERELHHDVLVHLGPVVGLGDHPLVVGAEHLRGDGTVDDLADLAHHVEVLPPALGDQRGVGGHAVDDAHRRRVADLLQVSRVDEELHADRSFAPPFRCRREGFASSGAVSRKTLAAQVRAPC